jgi:anti-sigma regulatory factor (Ser/Thr protein kinase)
MPYYRCRCGLMTYSAAGYSTVGSCPACSAPLIGSSNGALNGSSNGAEPAEPVRRTLPARPHSPAEARRAVHLLTVPAQARETLMLLVSELVTNSIRHAGNSAYDPAGLEETIDLTLMHAEDEVHVSVHDRGSGFSPADGSNGRASGGRGLAIVAALSKAWGVDCDDDGCTVWCTLDAPVRS